MRTGRSDSVCYVLAQLRRRIVLVSGKEPLAYSFLRAGLRLLVANVAPDRPLSRQCSLYPLSHLRTTDCGGRRAGTHPWQKRGERIAQPNGRVGFRWCAVALLLPVALILVAVYTNVLLGASAPSAAELGQWLRLFPMFPLLLIFDGPLGEEPGWRGSLGSFSSGRKVCERYGIAGPHVLAVKTSVL